MSKPLKIVVAYTASDPLPASGATAQLPVPELSLHFGLAAASVKDISLDTRKHPLRFDATTITRENTQVKLPDSMRLLELPDSVKRTAPGAEWVRNFKAEGNIVRCGSVLKIDRLEISPAEYDRLRDFRRSQTADVAALPLVRTNYAAIPEAKLTQIFPEADSFLESDRIAVEVRKDNSYTIVRTRRRRILTYAGVKNHSELRFTYFPKYRNIKIDAVVTTPDGRKHRLDPRHIIETDAAWVSSAPRYPKAQIKTAVLPAVQVGAVVIC